MAADLERSGLFQPLDRASFIDRRARHERPAALPRLARHQRPGPGGRPGLARARTAAWSPKFRLWDVFSGRQLGSQRFAVAADDWRRLGHLVADLVYERLTGEKGYFDTQVVFVDETGPKDKRNKRLAIMDQDGANIRLLSQGQELVLTPRFSPTSTKSPSCSTPATSRACSCSTSRPASASWSATSPA